jgi:glyoxylase-like metal-dependent hydrolase (beta-lactamase superfamily II)
MRVTTVRSDGCLSYVLTAGGEAAIIDPARDTGRYRQVLAAQGAAVRFVIDTHTHADHLSGGRKLADETGARLVMSRDHVEQWRAAAGAGDKLGIADILRANSGVKVDVAVKDGETVELGGTAIQALAAPGHTRDAMVLLAGDRIFSGDTLLIGQIGRCDLPGGDGGSMYGTLFEKLAALPDETFVYPGHDYQQQTVSALGFERVNNRFLKPRSRDEFVAFLATAFPSLTGPGMQCGAVIACGAAGTAGTAAAPGDPLGQEIAGFMDGYFFAAKRPEDVVLPAALAAAIERGDPVRLLDVREPSEYEAGHLAGAANLSVHAIGARIGEVGPDKDAPVVTICRSGKRSGWAAMFLRVAGYRDVRSLDGGTLAWERAALPVKKGSNR